MRPDLRNLAAVFAGVAAALLLVGAVPLGILPRGSSAVIVAAGSTRTVPTFVHLNDPSTSGCTGPRCGNPGELWLDFAVARDARLAGSLSTTALVDVWLGNAPGMSAACSLSNPSPPCAQAEGAPYLYESPTEVTSIDLGQVQFNVAGSGDVLPAGEWTILLINWSDSPVSMTVASSVTVTPTW